MPRDPLAWQALLRHWTRCLGEGGAAVAELGRLEAVEGLDLAELLPGGPGWAAVQACLRHDPEGAFRTLYYGLALRGLEALPPPEQLVMPDAHETPQISVLIPVHNHWPITLNCLRSLVVAANGTRFEVILADDASIDATRQIEAQLPWLRVWRSERNQGFLDTCNGAAALARGEVLLLLNNDTLVGDHCLDQLWDTLQRHPEAGVVGAASWGPDGLPLEVGGIIWASGEVWNHGRGFTPERWFALSYERQCGYVSGCGLAIRTGLWQQLDGFDPRYRPAYCEDTDLCLRVREANHSVWVQPAARILHLEGLSHSRDATQGLKQHQVRNLVQLKQHWQTLLDSEQPPEGLPWLLAADRGLLGRPLALLLQPGTEDETICQQRGWAPLVLHHDWPLEWLVEHLTGPLLPDISLVGVVPAGRAIPKGWLQQVDATLLPQRPVGAAPALPALPGWDRVDLRILPSSSGLYHDGWLDSSSRLVIQLLGNKERHDALRLGLYLPEQGLLEGVNPMIQIQAETDEGALRLDLKPGLNSVVLEYPAVSASYTLVINLSSAPLVQPATPSDQRSLMAVLVDLERCSSSDDTVSAAVSQSVA